MSKTLRAAITGAMDELLTAAVKALPESYKAESWKITVAPCGDAADLMFHGYDSNDHECRGIIRVELGTERETSLPKFVLRVSFSAPLRAVDHTASVAFENNLVGVARATVREIVGRSD